MSDCPAGQVARCCGQRSAVLLGSETVTRSDAHAYDALDRHLAHTRLAEIGALLVAGDLLRFDRHPVAVESPAAASVHVRSAGPCTACTCRPVQPWASRRVAATVAMSNGSTHGIGFSSGRVVANRPAHSPSRAKNRLGLAP